MTDPFSGSQRDIGHGKASQPTVIDKEDNIWEVEALLAKWKQRRRVLYLVKWKDFPNSMHV